MKVLDLFSGIGGFSLGLERAGMETVAFCEIEDYPVSILNKHWPDIPVHRDIRELDGKQYRNKIDVVCGGFPCQPFSCAGKQKGKEDSRHLWPEMLRIIKESKPAWVVCENVAGFIAMALDDVLFDLEAEGFTTQSLVIPACAVGGIHRRDRVWIIAHATTERLQDRGQTEQQESSKEKKAGVVDESKRYGNSRTPGYSEYNGRNGSKDRQSNPSGNDRNTERQIETCESSGSSCSGGDDADTQGTRLQGGEICRNDEKIWTKSNDERPRRCSEIPSRSREFEPIGLPTEPPVCHRNDGVSDRVARLKALGNAVVPQIPELIGRAIIKSLCH